MKDRGTLFSETEVRNWCFQVFQGLEYMQQRGYFHRDLKPGDYYKFYDVIVNQTRRFIYSGFIMRGDCRGHGINRQKQVVGERKYVKNILEEINTKLESRKLNFTDKQI